MTANYGTQVNDSSLDSAVNNFQNTIIETIVNITGNNSSDINVAQAADDSPQNATASPECPSDECWDFDVNTGVCTLRQDPRSDINRLDHENKILSSLCGAFFGTLI